MSDERRWAAGVPESVMKMKKTRTGVHGITTGKPASRGARAAPRAAAGFAGRGAGPIDDTIIR